MRLSMPLSESIKSQAIMAWTANCQSASIQHLCATVLMGFCSSHGRYLHYSLRLYMQAIFRLDLPLAFPALLAVLVVIVSVPSPAVLSQWCRKLPTQRVPFVAKLRGKEKHTSMCFWLMYIDTRNRNKRNSQVKFLLSEYCGLSFLIK